MSWLFVNVGWFTVIPAIGLTSEKLDIRIAFKIVLQKVFREEEGIQIYIPDIHTS